MKSLYVKLAVSTIVIMLVSGLLAFMFANFYYQQKLKPDNDVKNTNIAKSIASYIENENDVNLESYLENIATIGYQIFLTNQDSKGAFYGDPFRDKDLPQSIINKVLKGEIYHGIAEYPQETFVTGFFANELTNTIGVPFQYEGEQYALFIRPNIKLLFNEMHFLFAWLLTLTIVLSIVFVLISTKYLINPISKLTAATERIAQGNFTIDLDINREDEIGKLAKSFSMMAKQLEKLDEMKSEFISNVSHDIQSPLSNIKGYVNLLENKQLTKDEKAHYFSVVSNEINRLSNLTKQLLLLASLDTGDELLEKETYLLSKQIREIIFNHQWRIHEKDIMISYTLPDIDINGDPSLLYNVWENLLTNAIKYNKENGTINISLQEEADKIIITFQDSGIGFSQRAKERAFERFYRADSARTRDIEGTGLGLSIVLSIIKLHKGELTIESEKNVGTTITVSLPKM